MLFREMLGCGFGFAGLFFLLGLGLISMVSRVSLKLMCYLLAPPDNDIIARIACIVNIFSQIISKKISPGAIRGFFSFYHFGRL
jgi:hypothetical protein